MCCCDGKSWAACAQSFALWQQATIEITRHDHSWRTLVIMFNRSHVSIGRASTSHSFYYCLFMPRIYDVFLCAHSVRGEPRTPAQRQRSGCDNIPSLLQRTAPIARSLSEDWTRHDLHILVTTPFCCDWKSRAVYAQSFAPWQQATIEITCKVASLVFLRPNL